MDKFQCYTHRYLGWKIHVHDSCDEQRPAASEQHEVHVKPDSNGSDLHLSDLEGEASIASPSKVTPSPEFLQRQQEYDYLLRQQYHHHHHPQLVHHQSPKLVTGPYQIRYQLLSRFPPQLTEQRRSPTKLAFDPAVNYVIQRDHNHFVHHHHHPLHQLVSIAGQKSSNDNRFDGLALNQSKLVADQQQLLVKNPVLMSSPNLHNVVYKLPSNGVMMQPPPMMIIQKKQPQFYQQAIRRQPPPMPRQPVFYERKKAIYKPMLSRMQVLNKQPYATPYYPTKLMKIDEKKVKIDSKAAQSEEQKMTLLGPMTMKLARNTGFDPGSIVIEKGFKPIIKKTMEMIKIDRSSEVMMQDEDVRENLSERYSDNFEPVFIPSPPDRNMLKKQFKKKQMMRTKLKLDNIDDMDAHYSKRIPKSIGISNSTETMKNSTETISKPTKERTKREALNDVRSGSWGTNYNREHDPDSQHYQHNYEDHDHSPLENHSKAQKSVEKSTEEGNLQASTGEIILANIEYIILTVVLYYAL